MRKRRLKNRLKLVAVRPLMWLHTALSGDFEQYRQWNRRVHQIQGHGVRLLGTGSSVPAVGSRGDVMSNRGTYRAGGGLLKTAMVGGMVLAAAIFSYENFNPAQDYTVTQPPGIQVSPADVAPMAYVQPPKEAVDHAIQGYYHQINRQYTEALAEYNAALQVHPNYPDVHWNKALIYHQLEQYSQAVVAYREMLRINPNDTDALYNMGYALDKLGRYSEALNVYDKILGIDASDIHAPIGKGIAHYHLWNFDGAISEFVKVIDTNPKYSLYNLACMYSVKGDTAQAFHFLEKALPNMDQEMLDWAKQDPDFESIRNTPRFQELIFGR
jgi:tetratricopeptide (TPR) repeat protein